jgi:hypothetical protein
MPEAATSVATSSTERMMLEMLHDRVATGVTSGLNGCCTVMWKANGKTTTLLIFLDSLFQEQRQMRDASPGDKTIWW